MENKRGDTFISIKLGVVMKRRICGLVLFLAMAAPLLFAQEALIREISGTVEVKAANAADWSPAVRGQSIARSTLISTGFKSSALIVIGNSTLSVQPLTRLSLEELASAEGSEKVDLSLRTGRVRANVKPPAEGKIDFTVRSPSSTASVRGTSFEFNGIELRVAEGTVHLSGAGRNGTYVGAGHIARANIETGRITGAVETAQEELAPSVPAGADGGPAIKVLPPPAGNPAVPPAGDIDAGFDWL
jgi:hypothetical protein